MNTDAHGCAKGRRQAIRVYLCPSVANLRVEQPREGHADLLLAGGVLAGGHEVLVGVAGGGDGVGVGAGPDADDVAARGVGAVGAAAVDDVDVKGDQRAGGAGDGDVFCVLGQIGDGDVGVGGFHLFVRDAVGAREDDGGAVLFG